MSSEFLWGAATSGLQVEGAHGRGPTDWDLFAAQPGRVAGGDTPDFGADHLGHLEEDLQLLRQLEVGAYRFAVSWARVAPDGETLNPAGLDVYDRLVDRLTDLGIEPFPTIVHMELPATLANRGGWANRATIDAYTRLAEAVHGRLGDRVRYWTTLNEVPLTTYNGYATGKFPPGGGRTELALPAIHHQLVAHGRAVAAMRSARPDCHYGIVGSVAPCYPATDAADDAAAAGRVDAVLNRTGLDPIFTGRYPAAALDLHHGAGGLPFEEEGDSTDITTPIDFFGLNYYTSLHVAHDPTDRGGGNIPAGLAARPVVPPNLPRSSFGWTVHTEGLRDTLSMFSREYPVPVFITENGTTSPDVVTDDRCVHDAERIDYLAGHIAVVESARADGVDVRGYFVWSLLDNFEWAAGYSQRFGLIHVDGPTGRRTPKDSYYWYQDLIRKGRAL